MAREALLAGLVLGVCAGCASLEGPSDTATGKRPSGREVRPDAPPEYDVLVAQQHAIEGRMDEALDAYRRAVAKDDDSAFLHRLVADTMARTGDLDGALEHALRAFELDPSYRPGRALLAQLYRMKREPEAAVALLGDESGAPLDGDAAVMLYQIHFESDRPEEALGVAQWMLDNDEEPMRAYIALANAYERLERPGDAEQALREALALDPGNLRIYGAIARLKRAQGDREGEIAIYREILDEQPDDHATLSALADAQMSEDDLEGAIATLEEVERRYPEDLRASVRLGFLYYEARRFGEASERFERALVEFPDEHEIAFFLGISRRRENQDEEALRAFASVPRQHEHYAEARTQMAAIYERRGDYAEAQQEIERALEVEPTRALSLYSATLRSKAGDLEGAVSFLEDLLEKEPGSDELFYNLGVVYGEADQTERAIEYMQKALEKNPDNASALNYVGYTWAEQGKNLDEAETMIQRAMELRPEDGYIVDSLGWVYYMRARPLVEAGELERARIYIDRALVELERADELTGGDPVVSEHMGDAYLLRGDRQRALELFLEAMELGPRPDEQPDLPGKLESLQREIE
jgi:tetratricopeptide (TPR) repeat protein